MITLTTIGCDFHYWSSTNNTFVKNQPAKKSLAVFNGRHFEKHGWCLKEIEKRLPPTLGVLQLYKFYISNHMSSTNWLLCLALIRVSFWPQHHQWLLSIESCQIVHSNRRATVSVQRQSELEYMLVLPYKMVTQCIQYLKFNRTHSWEHAHSSITGGRRVLIGCLQMFIVFKLDKRNILEQQIIAKYCFIQKKFHTTMLCAPPQVI